MEKIVEFINKMVAPLLDKYIYPYIGFGEKVQELIPASLQAVLIVMVVFFAVYGLFSIITKNIKIFMVIGFGVIIFYAMTNYDFNKLKKDPVEENPPITETKPDKDDEKEEEKNDKADEETEVDEDTKVSQNIIIGDYEFYL